MLRESSSHINKCTTMQMFYQLIALFNILKFKILDFGTSFAYHQYSFTNTIYASGRNESEYEYPLRNVMFYSFFFRG